MFQRKPPLDTEETNAAAQLGYYNMTTDSFSFSLTCQG